MQFSDDIQALRRGELDQETLIGRIKAYLGRSEANPSELRKALDEARQADHITAADYDLLTQCIADSQFPGDEGTRVALPPGAAFDDSMTRLATSLESTEGDQSTVDIGSRLRDRFILDEVVGAGGMGTVYRGRDILKIEAQDRNPYVAIKILNDSFKERPDAFIVLQREASRQQRLAHPNIATVYDFDRSGGIIYITMEYLDGVSLDHYIKHEVRPKGGLSLEEAMPVIEGMCAALSHAHKRNIVHADFKPGNCFITASNQLKVLDFGIARAMKDPARAGEETLFDPRSIGALTPAYASAEMLDNSADADPRDDIYALACVSYELLSGTHPFHRIPADQAKANNLKPPRIKHLTRRQNQTLARALEFDRDDRTRTVEAFLDGLSPSSTFNGLRVALGVGAGALVLVGALVLPDLLERWRGDELLQQIEAGQVEAAVGALDELSRPQQIRVLQEGRAAIQDHLRTTFERLMGRADAQVDFAAAEQVLAEGTELYPDSAALRELYNQFSQRRETYLSILVQEFEGYLAPQYLLPTPDSRDLHDLLDRLTAVDPTNPLLEDSRIPGAYADSVESALGAEDLGVARRFLDAGLSLTPADATLTDLRDRVEAAEQRMARQTRIAGLENELAAGAAAAESLSDLADLMPTVNELQEVDPGNAAVGEAGAALARRFASSLDSAREATTLAAVQAYLQQASGPWSTLGQPQMVEPAEDRRAALVQRQATLVEQARQAMDRPDMRGDDGQSAMALIARVRAIDPADPRPGVLQAELVQTRRSRAEQHMQEGEWDAARGELAALDALTLTAEQGEALAEDRSRIDTAEQQAIERAANAQRLAEAQRQAELERQERERQQQLAAQREARIDTAADALRQSLTDFDAERVVPSIRAVLSRVNELEALQADHPELADAGAALDRAVEQAIRGARDPAEGLALVRSSEQVLGPRPWLSDLRGTLQARQTAQQAQARRDAINRGEQRLQNALAEPSTLAEDGNRTAARRALAELEALLADAAAVASARRQYVAALLQTASGLMADKRFTVAEQVLADAATAADGSRQSEVAEAQASLASAREAFRLERQRQETQARIEALAQRFSLEVGSGRLSRARATLDEYRQLDPDSTLAQTQGYQQLAAGYERIGRQRLEAGNPSGARELVDAGLQILADHAGLLNLRTEVERDTLLDDIANWFRGNSSLPVSSVRGLTQRYRTLAPEGYANQEVAWANAAATHLSAIQGNPDRYNRFLQDARSLLDDDGPLGSLATIVPRVREEVVEPPDLPEEDPQTPAVPALASSDLLGRWCADNLEIEFERNRMVFTLDGGRANYPVRGYSVLGDTIHVTWDDRRLGSMVFEFGEFTNDKEKMVQIRGRPADENSWQTYNRNFLRCG